MRKLRTARRLLRSGGAPAVAAAGFDAAARWWRQGEPWQVVKSPWVRLGGARIGIHDAQLPSFRSLLRSGQFEKPERQLIRKYVDPALPVIEFGGCIGVVSCTTNRLLRNRSRHVVVEANPSMLSELEANRARNRAGFSILHRAVGYGSKEVEFHVSADPLDAGAYRAEGQMFQVPAVTFGEIADQERFAACTLISDIEGMECELVQHEGERLALTAETMVIEVHDKVRGVDAIGQMLYRLYLLGFRMRERIWDTYVFENHRPGRARGIQ